MPISSVQCSTPGEAASLLAGNRRARFFGGGTLLMRAINEGDQSFDTLVSVDTAPLRTIQISGNRLVIGSCASMSDVINNRDSAFLTAVARSVGGPAVRNMATVGGNLFAPAPYGDFATALLALNAEVNFADGTAAVPLQEFLINREAEPRKLVGSVALDRPALPEEFRYLKVSRVKPKGIAVMTLSAYLPRVGSTLSNVRIAYGAMAATPVRIPAVERVLEGRSLDQGTVEAAMQVATDGITPPTDALASAWYRQEVAPAHLRRLLLNIGN